MFEETRIYIIAGFIIFVAYLNYALVRAIRSGDLGREYRVYRDAMRNARNPWRGEDENLEELRNIVRTFEENENESPSSIENESSEI